MLASAEQVDIIKKITDHPWQGWPWQMDIPGTDMKITLMSSGLAVMVVVAIVLILVILPVARHYRQVPKGGRNVLELILLFIRDMVARPALHDKAYRFLPFLATMFVFVLGMNLSGLVPMEAISELAGLFLPLHGKEIGGTPTALLAVTGGLSCVTLIMVLVMGMKTAALRYHHHAHLPLLIAIVLSPVLWIWGLSPKIPGVTGAILKLPLTVVEFAGTIARCFALMIRLFANMISGHTLLAVFLMLIFQAAVSYAQQHTPHVFYVFPLCVAASVGICLLELLVALIQAYVFTFLTAIFIGLAMEESH